ncbi:MAG: isochorismate synthase MenF [Arachnia sp.]
MTFDLGSRRLRATTVAIDDPGPLDRFLSTSEPSAAFIRDGDGIVTVGEVARFITDFADAGDVWWSAVAETIDHDSELPGSYGTGPLAIGSFAFDPDASNEPSVLIVPQTIIGRRKGQAWVTKIGEGRINLELPNRGEPLEPPDGVRLESGSMSEQGWADIVGEVVDLIQRGEVRKVVLARDLLAVTDSPIDLRYVLRQLSRLYPSCWSYLVDGMVGATPELLVRRQGGLITSRVLAGTVSLDPEHTDAVKRAAELARSHKQVTEHQFAVDSVAQALEPFCSAMNVPDAPSILPLPNVLHLSTDITGSCEPGTSALALAAALHPSAAVCGTPTFAAAEIIEELETLDRGRYAGPIGWVDARGDGEWMIALRGGYKAEPDPTTLQLFAGAGIVADSDPDQELAETSAKFVPMLQALGVLPSTSADSPH